MEIIKKPSISNSYNKDINKELYKKLLLEEYIYITPKELNNKIDDIILIKLKKQVESKCIKYGYIIPNTIEIISNKNDKNKSIIL